MSYNKAGGIYMENENSTDGSPTLSVGTGSIFKCAGTVTDSATRTVSGTGTYTGTNTFDGPVAMTSAVSLTGTFTNTTKMRYVEAVQSLSTATTAALTPCGMTVIKATAASKTFTLSTALFLKGYRKYVFCTAATTTRVVTIKAGTPSSGTALTFDGTNYCVKFMQANTYAEFFRATSNRIALCCRSSGASTGVVLGVTGAS